MDLFKLLTPNTTLLTPNSRLSAVLLKQHHALQMAAGQTSWASLDILPLASWVQRTWREYTARNIENFPLLLTPEQEQVLWEEILKQAPESAYLLQLSRTAELAKSAWAILKQWRVKLDNPALQTTEDGVIFQTWAQQFVIICETQHWLDTHSVADQLMTKITRRLLQPPEHLLLVGFTEITPQQQDLFAACEQAGTRITHYEPDARENTLQRIRLNDHTTEIITMARWAKQVYASDEHATVCCVVPSLESSRERVLQIFCSVFSENNSYCVDHTTLPFNISAGRHLSRYPVVHLALQLLALPHQVPVATLSQLLRSPFIGEAESEMYQRAQLDNQLRQENITKLSLAELCKKTAAANCPAFVKRIQDYLSVPYLEKNAPVSDWLSIFMKHLTAWGWPGERSLDSAEYQTAGAWLKILTDYATYDRVLSAVTYQQALHYLSYLTTKRMFQPESPPARIQILGTLEAAETPFDYLWVMGMDDTAWPPAPNPNPFIPQSLQKMLNMPHATAERELTFTRRLTQQLQRSASHVIFSHAQQNDAAELRSSPLIIDLPDISLEALALAAFIPPAELILATSRLETLQDEKAMPLRPDEKIRGGTTIIKNQSACPFKAFSDARLHTSKVDAPTLGLNSKERGTIIHSTLESIWTNLQNQANLIALSDEALLTLIQEAIAYAIAKSKPVTKSNRRHLALEAERLQKLVYAWLQLEKQRPDFKIKSLEEKRETQLGKITLRVIADRVDELSDGSKIIIDYKTGKMSPTRDWFGERPNEPQLPLYYLLDADKTVGIFFAQLNADEMGWKGASSEDLGIKTVKLPEGITWAQQTVKWREIIEKLSDDFYHGKAAVDPKDPVQTCQYCHLHALCRVHEVGENALL